MAVRTHTLVKATLFIIMAVAMSTGAAHADNYLVVASQGPTFASPEEAVQILESMIFPSFDYLMKLEAEGKILASGLPVADREFVFILAAESNEKADQLLRDVPAWPLFSWEVIPLQTLEARAAKEREVVRQLKQASR